VPKLSRTKLRHNARIAAMQALYQWQFTHNDIADVLKHTTEEKNLATIDQEYFQQAVTTAINNSADIDEKISAYLDRELKELNPLELSVLRLAAYEFLYRPDVPYKVIINEALELTKQYGSEQGHKYVNAVLDKMALKLRALEHS
jgi:transcription antitermination protein NusB